jgi:hypothetical protein
VDALVDALVGAPPLARIAASRVVRRSMRTRAPTRSASVRANS